MSGDLNLTLDLTILDDIAVNNEEYQIRPETYLVPIVFALIFIVGVVGNGTIVVVFLRHRAMRNVPNIYVLSLALADLLVLITCVPFLSMAYTIDSWPWGEAMCGLIQFAKYVSVGVSAFTLAALSANPCITGYLKKLHATDETRRETCRAVFTATIIWLIATALAIPAVAGSYLRVVELDSTNKNFFVVCFPYLEMWGPSYTKTVVLLHFLIYYLLPLAAIGVCYVSMAGHLIGSTQMAPEEVRGTRRQMQTHRKMAMTVLAFVITFAICFLPTHVFMLWFYYCPTALNDYNDSWHALRIVGFCLSYLKSCINPIALYCISGAFRKHFNWHLLCRGGGSTQSSTGHVKDNSLSMTNSRHHTSDELQ